MVSRGGNMAVALVLVLFSVALCRGGSPGGTSVPQAFVSCGKAPAPHSFSLSSTSTRAPARLRTPASRRPSLLRMSEMPFDDPAKPDNDIGYSKLSSETAKLALDMQAGTKFLGDLPMQRVIVTANLDVPEAYDLSKPTAAEQKLKYEMPTDKVEDPNEELEFRSQLFNMLDKAGGPDKAAKMSAWEKDVRLTLTFGNANGYFRRWPNQQYTINLLRINNHAFELAPEAEEGSEEAIHDMDIVSLKAEYHAEQRMFKISGYMDGCLVKGELRALNLGGGSKTFGTSAPTKNLNRFKDTRPQA